jgi:hypothetical protein
MERVRQFITSINRAVKTNKNKPITILTPGKSLYNVSGARPYTGTGRTSSGAEAYTDVIIDSPNIKEIRISLKENISEINSAGDLRTVELILPGVTNKFTRLLNTQLLDSGYDKGEMLPELYGRLNPLLKERIVVGNQSMGGPIDYVYLENTTGDFDSETATLEFFYPLIPSKLFAKQIQTFLVLKPFREDQTYDPEAQKGGILQIFGKSPTRGDDIIKIFISDTAPKDAIVVDISL